MNPYWRGNDPLLPEAIKLIIKFDNASASFLQRKLVIGYARAALILDQLQFFGVVGPADGMAPRKILVSSMKQAGAKLKPKQLTPEELQEKVFELEVKLNRILNAFQDVSWEPPTYLDVNDDSDDIKEKNIINDLVKQIKEKKIMPTVSDIQRKFNIRYARSARILDELKKKHHSK
jgi:DNA segregation ATPase FtsK/SpoIIIE-like protein